MHTYFLESEHNGANGWPTIVIPSVPDPSLAPSGHHVLHATMAAPYRPWEGLDRGSDAYEERKRMGGEVLMGLVRQV
jgi:phytoene dehydrogenase-like protein